MPYTASDAVAHVEGRGARAEYWYHGLLIMESVERKSDTTICFSVDWYKCRFNSITNKRLLLSNPVHVLFYTVRDDVTHVKGRGTSIEH